MIALGFNVNAKDKNVRYPLSSAIKANHNQDEIIPLLIKAGAKFIKKIPQTTNEYYIDPIVAESSAFQKLLGNQIARFSLSNKNVFLQKVLTLQPESSPYRI